MIKTPKLNQEVYYADDNGEICKGKISQIYNDPSIGVDNFLYIDKKYIFSTKKRALKYRELLAELDHLVSLRNLYEKQIKKVQNKYESLLR